MTPRKSGLPAEWDALWRQTEADAERARSEGASHERDMEANARVLARARPHLRSLVSSVLERLRALARRLDGVTRLQKAASRQQGRDAVRWLLAGLTRLKILFLIVAIPVLYVAWFKLHYWLAGLALAYFGPQAWYGIIVVALIWILLRLIPKK
jgi:Flp pilus assembly protein TadB